MEALGMAAVILASGLAFAAVIWAIGSTGHCGGKQPPNPPPRAITIKEPPLTPMWKTKTTTWKNGGDES